MASSGQSSEYGAISGASSGAATPVSGTKEDLKQVQTLPTLTKKNGGGGAITEMIQKGRTLRVQKNTMPKRTARPPPTPALPRGMIATDRDVKMSRRATRRQARCLRKHNIVLSDRMDELSKPTRRQLINMWRTYADVLTPEQIVNLQTMLDASDPFKPDQAYEYFVNLRKQRKRSEEKEKASGGVKKELKKDLSALCGDRRFAWARSATVAFARGIQQRLSRPGNFQLEGSMLRLSDIVLDEMCSYSKTRAPSRQSKHPKARFMVEMADKIAVWIDEILEESDERMLMMDFDEDDEVEVEEAKRKKDDEKAGKEKRGKKEPDGKPGEGGGAALGAAGSSGAIPTDAKSPTGGATPADQKKEDVKPGEAAPSGGAKPIEGAEAKPATEAAATASPATATPAAATTAPAAAAASPPPAATPPPVAQPAAQAS